jgi:two-component system response regulator AtoC
MEQPVKILIADDDKNILYAFSELLKREGYEGLIASDGKEALIKVKKEQPNIIFLDITMPSMDGIEVLKNLKSLYPSIPVIIITGFGTMHTAIKAIQHGAFEYLTKPLDLIKVREVIKKALSLRQCQVVKLEPNFQFDADISKKYEIIGNSPQMQEVFKLIGSVSTTTNATPVLILGESGTGKELVARAIHNNSSNKLQPFIAINCNAFPESLLESELFGHEKGSFTGAISRKIWKFEAAKAGTIFLDEIGNLSLNLQQKLLRVIQNREFERVGGNETTPVLARFIAATNVNLAETVKNGNFREDLFYRLNVASIRLSPLRERKNDIPLLIEFFLQKFNFHLNKKIIGLSDKAFDFLISYDYPGNVRELANILERSLMLTKGDVITEDHFHEYNSEFQHIPAGFPIISDNYSVSRKHILNLFEKEFLNEMLKKFNGNVAKAANASDMTRQNFQRLMQKYDIKAENFRK